MKSEIRKGILGYSKKSEIGGTYIERLVNAIFMRKRKVNKHDFNLLVCLNFLQTLLCNNNVLHIPAYNNATKS
jgi:hypothetical protein